MVKGANRYYRMHNTLGPPRPEAQKLKGGIREPGFGIRTGQEAHPQITQITRGKRLRRRPHAVKAGTGIREPGFGIRDLEKEAGTPARQDRPGNGKTETSPRHGRGMGRRELPLTFEL
jgi:hypothetical protein